MNKEEIKQHVHTFYWDADKNCATTTIIALGIHFDIVIHPKVLDAIIGMHGAGGFGAQCGLVEGALLFIGLYGKEKGYSDIKIIDLCNQYAVAFTQTFKSLLCSELRPEGFSSDNPPHLCEDLTNKTILFAIDFVEQNMRG